MEDNGLKILEAIENDYDYKLIDHVFIFHSLEPLAEIKVI